MSKEPSHAAMPTRKYRPSGQSAEPVDDVHDESQAQPDGAGAAAERSDVGVGDEPNLHQADTAPEQDQPAPSAEAPAAHADLREMESAPLDRRIILKAADGREVEASWRVTRQYVPASKGGAWHETGVWAIWNSGGAKVPFEPVGWREAP